MSTALGRPSTRSPWFEASIWTATTVLIAFNLAHHAVWLDEAQAWCLVRDSASWAEWRWNMRNEGHPWLWYALLVPLAKGGLPAWSMQVLHGVIASTTVSVVLFRALFPLLVRVAVVVRPRPPMPTIDADTEDSGPFLRRMREAHGIELRELAERSKIGVAYLTALEADDFLKLPAPVYVRGFLGEYARMLGLDPERVKDSYLDRYRSARGDVRDADGNAPPRRRARPTPAD